MILLLLLLFLIRYMYKEYNILKKAIKYSKNIASLLFITIHNNNIVIIFTSFYDI